MTRKTTGINMFVERLTKCNPTFDSRARVLMGHSIESEGSGDPVQNTARRF